MIEKVKVEELAPYIISSFSESISKNKKLPNIALKELSEIYPNPASSFLFFKPSKNFEFSVPIKITIYDLMGKVRKSFSIQGKGNPVNEIPISDLQNGSYIIKAQQKFHQEHFKIIKNSK